MCQGRSLPLSPDSDAIVEREPGKAAGIEGDVVIDAAGKEK
jgi:hypothetical protein